MKTTQMKFRFWKVRWCFLLCGLAANLASGQETDPASSGPERLITNVWVDTPLSQILRDISMETQVTIALDPTAQDSLISMEAEKTPLEECLRKICAGQGLVVRKMDERFYLVGSGRPGSPTFEYLADLKTVSLKYVATQHLMKILPPDLRPYVSIGDRTTEVLVYAPAGKVERIQEIIKQVDVPSRQIVLEVLVAEVLRENGSALGIDWEAATKHLDVGFKNGAELITGVARYTNVAEQDFWSLMFTLRALVKEGKASIRSRPRVATVNGEKASIDVSLEEYFNIVTDINGGLLRTELQVVKSGVVLEMIPQIGEDGDITIAVKTEVSDVASESNKMNGVGAETQGDLPIIRRRKADTTVRVKEGGAIVIGGLIESVERSSTKRVPILGSVPLVGLFFQKKAREMSEKEVVIFISPRILEDNESPLPREEGLINLEEERARLQGEPVPDPAIEGKP
jgi:type II secretory pathway component GspD/PulD (secretin)